MAYLVLIAMAGLLLNSSRPSLPAKVNVCAHLRQNNSMNWEDTLGIRGARLRMCEGLVVCRTPISWEQQTSLGYGFPCSMGSSPSLCPGRLTQGSFPFLLLSPLGRSSRERTADT